jgi:hypothetical protein
VAKHDEDTGSPLAEALAAPLAAGSLEVALHAARAFHMRHPGEEDPKRVMEALELLQAQVWFSGADDEASDPRYGLAAQHLEALDLPGALARYEEIVEAEGDGSRAVGLALNVRVVLAAASGGALPARDAPVEAPPDDAIANNPIFQETTRIAGANELPLNAFDGDEPTSNVKAVLTKEAFPDEPTRTLNLGDYQLFEEVSADSGEHPALYGDDDAAEISTGILDAAKAAKLVEKTRQPPPLKPRTTPTDAKGRALPPAPKIETREVTRIAGANELPLDEFRRQIEGERSDKDLDDLLGEMTNEPKVPAKPPPPAPPQLAPEPSIAIDVSALRFGKPVAPAIEKSIAIDLSEMTFMDEAPAPEPSIALDISELPAFESEELAAEVKQAERQQMLQSFEPSLAIDITVLPDFEAMAEAEALAEAQAEADAAEAEAEAEAFAEVESEKTPPGIPVDEIAQIPPTAPMQALDLTRPMPAITVAALEAEEALPVTARLPAAHVTAPLPSAPKPGPVVPKPPGFVVPAPPVILEPEILSPPPSGSSPPPPMVVNVEPPMVAAPELYAPAPDEIYTPPPPDLYTPPPIDEIEAIDEVLPAPPDDFEERVTAPPALHAGLDEVTAPTISAEPPRGPAVPPPPAVVIAPPPISTPPPPPPSKSSPPPPLVVPIAPPSALPPLSVDPIHAPAPFPAPRPPPPPAPLPPLSADPVHAPLDTAEVVLPSDHWPDEPGDEPDAEAQRVEVGVPEISWAGVRVQGRAAIFEPGAESVEADTWGDPGPTKTALEREAEALVARGELGEALRVYQDLAAQHPDQPHVWDRIAQIARLLQQRSGG